MKPNQFLYLSIHICVNTHIYKCNCELEPRICIHKGNVDVMFHTNAIFLWNINEWWPPLCSLGTGNVCNVDHIMGCLTYCLHDGKDKMFPAVPDGKRKNSYPVHYQLLHSVKCCMS